MNIPTSIQTFHFAGRSVDAFMPSIEWVQQQFEKKEAASAPYWAQVWPAAKALCEVIAAEPELVKDKTVLELAAGLGLPSMLAAQLAKNVISSDYIQEAVDMMKLSVAHNNLVNVQCRMLDWNKLDRKLSPDVLLLSDINYDPKDFDQLYKVLTSFIQQGTAILLSTPQRLMAKHFMEQLKPWKVKTYTVEVPHKDETVFTSVWMLKKR
jgi:predicted nicotinamide N-methyase